MTVDANARAVLIGEEGQLEMFRVASPRPGASGLVWRDPPPDRRRVLTGEIIELLRANPGRWAVVREYHSLAAAKGGSRWIKHPVDIELRGVEEPPGSVLYARAAPGGGLR